MDEVVDCPSCGHESDLAEVRSEAGHCPVCGGYNYDLDMARHYSSRLANPTADLSGSTLEPPTMGLTGEPVATSIPGAIGKMVWNGSTMTGQEDTPTFNPGPMAPALETPTAPTTTSGTSTMSTNRTSAQLRIAAATFIDSQNTTDPTELAYRAARLVEERTWSWPRTASAAARELFVAAVLAGCDCGKDQGCEDCGAEAGEDCRPWCTGQAAHEDDKAEKAKKKSHRTAAILPDFADELMFDS